MKIVFVFCLDASLIQSLLTNSHIVFTLKHMPVSGGYDDTCVP